MAYKGSTGTSMSYIQGGRRRKHKAAKPSTSCTKCIHFVDAGDRMFCDFKKGIGMVVKIELLLI